MATNTIDFQALKAQLKLLGHELPDEQVAAILKDMNIQFVGGGDAAPPPSTVCEDPTAQQHAPHQPASIMHTSTHQGRPAASVPRVSFSNNTLPSFPTRTNPATTLQPSESQTPSGFRSMPQHQQPGLGAQIPDHAQFDLQALEDDDEVLLQRLSLDGASRSLSTHRPSHPAQQPITATTRSAGLNTTTYHHPSLPHQQQHHERQPQQQQQLPHTSIGPLGSGTHTAHDAFFGHGIATASPRYSERPVLPQRSSLQGRESGPLPHGYVSSFPDSTADEKELSKHPSSDSSHYFSSSVQAIMKQASPDGTQQTRRTSLSGGARRVSLQSSSPSPPLPHHSQTRAGAIRGLQYGPSRGYELGDDNDSTRGSERASGSPTSLSDRGVEEHGLHNGLHNGSSSSRFQNNHHELPVESDRLAAPHVGIAELQAQLRKYQQAAAGIAPDSFEHDDAENYDGHAPTQPVQGTCRPGVVAAKSSVLQVRAGSAQPSRGGEGKPSQPISVLQQLQQRAANTGGRAWQEESRDTPLTHPLKPRPLSARPLGTIDRKPSASVLQTSSHGARGLPQHGQPRVEFGGARYADSSRDAWQEEQRAVRSPGSPRGSVASMARSTTSTFSSKQPNGIKKVDRVARYKELSQNWEKDKFLSAASAAHGRTPTSGPRKVQNFHTHFAALHAAEASECERTKKESRAKSNADLSEAAAFVAPTSKRRDELRWQTRCTMRATGNQ